MTWTLSSARWRLWRVVDYGSHLPTLATAHRLRGPWHQALEFGSGDYSTSWFLELEELQLLVSVEADPDWRSRWQRRGDARHHVLERRVTPAGFDVVLIDDGRSDGHPDGMQTRLETIHFVMPRRTGLVLVHDANVPEYVEALDQYDPFQIVHTDPPTAVIV